MGIKILHLSDIHFGSYQKKNSDGLLEKDKNGKDVFKSSHRYITANTIDQNIEIPDPKILANLLINKHKPDDFDFIIDSGDLAWSGIENDYNYYKTFISIIKDHFVNKPIIIIPGNHDVDNSTSTEFTKRQNAYIQFIKEFYGTDFEKFYLNYTPTDRHTIVNYGLFTDQKLLIVGLNSAAELETEKKKVFIKNETLIAISKFITENHAADFFKIFVIHHHLHPFIEPEWKSTTDTKKIIERVDSTLIVNSASIQTWLSKNKFNLLLHGHRHLFHGRVDLLWHSNLDVKNENKLIVIGSGSSGVNWDWRDQSSKLSYNTINITKVGLSNYQIDVNVNEILDQAGQEPEIKEAQELKRSINTGTNCYKNYYEANKMDVCHEFIANSVKINNLQNKRIYNFISSIESNEFVLPIKSCMLDGAPVTIAEIIKSFKSLHPEYDKTEQWKKINENIKSLNQKEKTYSINHGSRLFGINEYIFPFVKDKDESIINPILNATKRITQSDEDSKGYVGLFNYEIDILKQSTALPGLTGLQLIPRRDGDLYLDIVATFRTIELSFWWVVNMYEMITIMDFAIRSYKEYSNGNPIKPGKITFFSAMATWKSENLNIALQPEIEEINSAKLYAIVSGIEKNENSAFIEFKEQISDFKKHLSEINISFNNLEIILDLFNGIKKKNKIVETYIKELKFVCDILNDCLKTKKITDQKLNPVKDSLQKIIDLTSAKVSIS